MLIVSFRIWTQVTDSNSNNDNHYFNPASWINVGCCWITVMIGKVSVARVSNLNLFSWCICKKMSILEAEIIGNELVSPWKVGNWFYSEEKL